MGTVRKILISHIMIAKVVLTLTLTNLVMAAPQLFSTPALPSPRINEGQVVSSVISTLQPAIAAAVAQALRGSSLGSSSRPSGGSGPAFTGSTATPAKYNYVYKVADDKTQTYISQAEEREGLEVKGTYSYVDPTGAIITVNYTAGELGYQETRERQEGAVTIKPQPAPAPGSGGAGSGLDIDSLIAQVIASLEPAIQSSVSNVLNRRG